MKPHILSSSAVDVNRSRVIDRERLRLAVTEMLLAFGEDLERPEIFDTPRRVTDFYIDFFQNSATSVADIFADTIESPSDQFIAIKNMSFYSICEHHLLPFSGKVDVVYLPGASKKIVGFSTLLKLVRICASKFQIQERITKDITDSIVRYLSPAGLLVRIFGEHLCVNMRASEISQMQIITSQVSGVLEEPNLLVQANSFLD